MNYVKNYIIHKFESGIIQLLILTTDECVVAKKLKESDLDFYMSKHSQLNEMSTSQYFRIKKQELPKIEGVEYTVLQGRVRDEISFYWLPNNLI